MMLNIITKTDEQGRVYVESSTGERWCEVMGSPGVTLERRGRMIALAIKLFDVIDAATDRGEALVSLQSGRPMTMTRHRDEFLFVDSNGDTWRLTPTHDQFVLTITAERKGAIK